MTRNPHPHVITGECPVPCLTGIIRHAAVSALTHELRGEGYPHGSVAGIVKLRHLGKLGEVRNIGPRAILEIEEALRQAGLI